MRETWRGIAREMAGIEERAMMEESLNEDFDIKEDMEIGGKQSVREQPVREKWDVMEERCEVMAEKETLTTEAVIMKYGVLKVQCEVLSVAGNPEALEEHGTVEEVERLEEETELKGTPIWA